MKFKNNKNKTFHKSFANQNIKHLFDLAENSKDFADRYVFLAKKIGMKFRIGLPQGFKFKFCNSCYSLYRVGQNCRVRTRKGKIVYSCFKCNSYDRFGFVKKK